MSRLERKVAIVSGAGSGIGAATAHRFAREGARVLLVDIDGERAKAIADEIGSNAASMAGDHCRECDNRKAVETALERFGALHILHNNAAISEPGGLVDMTAEAFRRVIEINLVGPFLLSKAAVPALRATAARGEDATILFTASVQAIMVRPGFAAYSASKHGLAGLIGSAALELAPKGIRVNGLCPGPVDTPLLRRLARKSGDEEGVMTRYRSGIPIQRMITPEEVAALATFLCSDEARAITGTLYPIDGGLTAR